VLAFNLTMTAWIGEWRLVTLGALIHGTVALGLVTFARQRA
jgi:hypothetical protein